VLEKLEHVIYDMSKRTFDKTGFKGKKQASQKKQRVVSVPTVLKDLEYKYYDQAFQGNIFYIPFTTAWTDANDVMPSGKSLVGPIVLGDNINQRSGRKILVHAIRLRFRIRVEADSTLVSDVDNDNLQAIRFIALLDKRPNGTAPSLAASLEDYGFNTMLNKNQLTRYKILKDKIINPMPLAMVLNGTDFDNQGADRLYKMNIKFPGGLQVDYNQATNGDYRDVESNGVFFGACCTNNEHTITYQATCRVAYTDL